MAVTLAWDLPPDEALAFFRDKGLQASFAWQDIVNAEHDVAFTVAKMLDLDLLADVRDAVDAAIAEGKTAREFVDELKPELVRRGWWGEADMTDPQTGEVEHVQLGSPRRLRTIFHTNMQTSYAAGHWSRIEDHKAEAPYLMYDAVRDSRTRPQHAAWDGKVLPVDDPWWGTHYPPNGWNCFLPDTRIAGRVEAGLRCWYQGKACEITTRSGRLLRVTADHPVLTRRGWVIAQQLAPGDDLVGYRRPGAGVDGRAAPVEVDDEQPVPRAEELFEALSTQALAVGEAPALELDDHVAGAEVDVAAADGVLGGEPQPALVAGGVQGPLVRRGDRGVAAAQRMTSRATLRQAVANDAVLVQDPAHVGASGAELAGERTLRGRGAGITAQDLGLEGGIALVRRAPGGAELPRHAARALFDGLPLERFRLASPAQDDAVFAELARHGRARDAGLLGYLVDAQPGAVALDPVVEIRQFDFAGHVYDFQTTEGLVAAEGIVAHNCRCSVIQLDRSQLDEAGLEVTERPEEAVREWTNPRTGEVQQIPAGVDPGWAYHPGRSRTDRVREILREKVAATGALGAAARAAVERGTGGADDTS